MSRYGKKILLTSGGGSIKKICHYDKVKELLNDDELDTLVEGNAPYPVSAKNTKLWKLYEDSGFEEIGNTRMLYNEVE